MNTRVVRGRYAPSPSGPLHLGNLRTALLAWLFARAAGGSFILRIEDLDHPRARPGAVASMIDALRWLGLDWEEGPERSGVHGPYIQSQRTALYEAALAQLRRGGLVYPCFCTRAELAHIASAPHAGEGRSRYPGTCRTLSSRERQRRMREGRQFSWRFRIPDDDIVFHDALVGPLRESPAQTVGDIVVRRADGVFAYQLAVVVDDGMMEVTQVVRGADLLGSTARQLALCAALGYRPPDSYAHVPLLSNAAGARLSKRDNATGLAPLRQQGRRPEAVVGWLAFTCGLAPSVSPVTASELVPGLRADAIRQVNTTAMIYSP